MLLARTGVKMQELRLGRCAQGLVSSCRRRMGIAKESLLGAVGGGDRWAGHRRRKVVVVDVHAGVYRRGAS